MDEIFFNSKSNHKYKELSNFYGNVEICYMQKRFANLKMKELFEDFKNCDNKKFINPHGIDYKRHTQSSVQYTTQYPENTTRNSQTNSIQKDTLNSRIGEFHFNNPAINQNLIHHSILKKIKSIQK